MIQLIKPFHEQQVGNLLYGSKRIADATAPKFVPKQVDFRF
ncbi:type I restriction modification system M subunit domain protein [Escherichia coli 6-537-08_S1_C2]|nr:type I restriction modification system M subunit domain protein [Escherichia coli P0301867.11]END23276.1 type I restriction modification system M subunit domain protein [Escherichia coli P0301867.8]ENG92747.1 type I restriction modification system M subunit domain protein [Escherichia coli P0301867.3]KEM44699.1 type I restriction modification system M subunit domain protein [Escherichia coli 6-537-08_S1_C1]KEN36414.1 type I restriction modification system M subunit domain protein [Escherichi